jgi:hypothetical protein
MFCSSHTYAATVTPVARVTAETARTAEGPVLADALDRLQFARQLLPHNALLAQLALVSAACVPGFRATSWLP